MTPDRRPVNFFLDSPMTRKRRVGVSRAPETSPEIQAIWDTVSAIPRGAATTYGEVARASGLPGRARQAGYALKMVIKEMRLPWHRVVGAGGKIVFPKTSAKYREQARLLRSEGIPVVNGLVDARAMIRLSERDR